MEMKIGDRLKQVRSALDLSQKTVCGAIEELQGNYSRYEKNVVTPSVTFLYNFAKKFNIRLEWLISGDGDMFENNNNLDNTKLNIVNLQKDLDQKRKEMGNRLKQIRQDHNYDYSQFGCELNEYVGSLQNMESGDSDFDPRFIKKLVRKFKVNEDWFLTGSGDMYNCTYTNKVSDDSASYSVDQYNNNIDYLARAGIPKERLMQSTIPQPTGLINLPIIDTISAGEPLRVEAIEPNEYYPISLELIQDPNSVICFRVNGNSMSPYVLHNDIIIISKRDDFYGLDNKIVAVRGQDGVSLKKLLIDHEKELSILMPVNQDFKPIIMDSTYIILGVLSHIFRKY